MRWIQPLRDHSNQGPRLDQSSKYRDCRRPRLSTACKARDGRQSRPIGMVAPAGFEPAISASPGARRAHFQERRQW